MTALAEKTDRFLRYSLGVPVGIVGVLAMIAALAAILLALLILCAATWLLKEDTR